MTEREQFIADIEAKIQVAYTEHFTMSEAQAKAGEFLHYQIQVSTLLKNEDLEARMRKSGVKAIRAAVYLSNAEPQGLQTKKPTEATLSSIIDTSGEVSREQEALDRAEADRDELKRIFDICVNAYHYFNAISKGSI